MTNRRVLGVDGSLVSSGYAFESESGIVTGRIKSDHLRGPERLKYIADTIEELFSRANADFLALEGYSMGSKGSRVFHIGELGGVLKLVAIRRGVTILTVPPTSVKVFATGKGRAEKAEIIRGIADNWGTHVKQHDEADAFVLLKIGQAFGDRRIYRAYPESRRRALDGCTIEYLSGLHSS